MDNTIATEVLVELFCQMFKS